jgi:acetyl-CoA synthetase
MSVCTRQPKPTRNVLERDRVTAALVQAVGQSPRLELPWSKWFSGGELNLSYNCLDRHVASGRRNKAAIIWEGEPGEVVTLTYQQLLLEVSKFANVLKSLGVQKGDRVAIYMGMCPALPIAMLAARASALRTP